MIEMPINRESNSRGRRDIDGWRADREFDRDSNIVPGLTAPLNTMDGSIAER